METVLVLLESALAIVPERYRKNASVLSWCKRFSRKPEEAILDVSYHYNFMKDWEYPGKWGRPDIVHFSLLYALESPLAKEGLLDVYVHTVEGKVIHIDKGTRLPRNYSRFIGIMSRVLRGEDTPLVHPLDVGIDGLLHSWTRRGYSLILFDEDGNRDKDWVDAEKAVLLIGGFAEGSFLREYPHDRKVSLWKEPLNTWNVIGEVIASRERRIGLL